MDSPRTGRYCESLDLMLKFYGVVRENLHIYLSFLFRAGIRVVQLVWRNHLVAEQGFCINSLWVDTL